MRKNLPEHSQNRAHYSYHDASPNYKHVSLIHLLLSEIVLLVDQDMDELSFIQNLSYLISPETMTP